MNNPSLKAPGAEDEVLVNNISREIDFLVPARRRQRNKDNLKRLLPSIERQLAGGATLVEIYEAACTGGLSISYDRFRKLLRELRATSGAYAKSGAKDSARATKRKANLADFGGNALRAEAGSARCGHDPQAQVTGAPVEGSLSRAGSQKPPTTDSWQIFDH